MFAAINFVFLISGSFIRINCKKAAQPFRRQYLLKNVENIEHIYSRVNVHYPVNFNQNNGNLFD